MLLQPWALTIFYFRYIIWELYIHIQKFFAYSSEFCCSTESESLDGFLKLLFVYFYCWTPTLVQSVRIKIVYAFNLNVACLSITRRNISIQLHTNFILHTYRVIFTVFIIKLNEYNKKMFKKNVQQENVFTDEPNTRDHNL